MQAPGGAPAPFAQATFAYRPQGSSEWTVLGTDDAPPYRVHPDDGGGTVRVSYDHATLEIVVEHAG